jgi:hypothetical protein
MKRYKYCAVCGIELEDMFFRYMDNFLQMKYFEEPDGSDNAFCSQECSSEALMLDYVLNDKEGGNETGD